MNFQTTAAVPPHCQPQSISAAHHTAGAGFLPNQTKPQNQIKSEHKNLRKSESKNQIYCQQM